MKVMTSRNLYSLATISDRFTKAKKWISTFVQFCRHWSRM